MVLHEVEVSYSLMDSLIFAVFFTQVTQVTQDVYKRQDKQPWSVHYQMLICKKENDKTPLFNFFQYIQCKRNVTIDFLRGKIRVIQHGSNMFMFQILVITAPCVPLK